MIKDKVFIKWSDKLCIGIPSIDDQHKVLVSIINELFGRIMEPENSQDHHLVFEKLELYTREHFCYEEALFDKFKWDHSSIHESEHKKLIAEIGKMKTAFEKSTDFDSSVEIMQFLKNWLVNHILESDRSYVTFLTEKGVR